MQSHIWLTATSFMGKNLRISSFIREPFLIYDFAPDPIWISLYMKKILFSFLSVYYPMPWAELRPGSLWLNMSIRWLFLSRQNSRGGKKRAGNWHSAIVYIYNIHICLVYIYIDAGCLISGERKIEDWFSSMAGFVLTQFNSAGFGSRHFASNWE